jgi:glycerophosphoryl diester phosphodiesterase
VADELGVRVDLWTINGESDMRCVLRYGVDGVMTDYVDVLNRALDGDGKRRRQAAHCARMTGARA